MHLYGKDRSVRGRKMGHVTALGDSMSDALATALIVLGLDRAFALAEAGGIAAQFIERVGPGRYSDRMTSAFAALGARRAA